MQSPSPCSRLFAHLARNSFIAIAAVAIAIASASAQTASSAQHLSSATSAESTPASTAAQSFEVASIHMVSPHTPDEWARGIGVFSTCKYPTNRFFVHNAPLRIIVSMVFDDTSPHVLGPDWLDSQLYSIDAEVEGDRKLSREEMKPLLRQLLEDRMHLQTHRESKITSGYELTTAKSEPKLQVSKKGKAYGQLLPGRVQAWHMPMDSFAGFLSSPVGRPVVDKTGLSGAYDIDLRFAPVNDTQSNLPDIFTAVQEQLGLRLEPAKVPVTYFVVDHVDRVPTEN